MAHTPSSMHSYLLHRTGRIMALLGYTCTKTPMRDNPSQDILTLGLENRGVVNTYGGDGTANTAKFIWNSSFRLLCSGMKQSTKRSRCICIREVPLNRIFQALLVKTHQGMATVGQWSPNPWLSSSIIIEVVEPQIKRSLL